MKLYLILVAMVFAPLAPVVDGTPLLPNSAITPTPTFTITGTLIDSRTTPAFIGGSFTHNNVPTPYTEVYYSNTPVVQQIRREQDGTLSIVYTVSSLDRTHTPLRTSLPLLDRLEIQGIDPALAIDAYVLSGEGLTPPDYVERFSTTIDLGFSGDSTDLVTTLILHTSAFNYDAGAAAVLSFEKPYTAELPRRVEGLRPLVGPLAVPEPASLALLPLALAALRLRFRRR